MPDIGGIKIPPSDSNSAVPSPSKLPPDLHVHPPNAIERRAWRAMMPDVATSADPTHVLVATAMLDGYGPHPRVIGAVATSASHRGAPIQWPRVAMHVISPLRRRGVATALLNAAAAAEAQRGLGTDIDGTPRPIALAAWSLIEPNSPSVEIWQAIGFTGRATLAEHDVSLQAAEARLAPLLDQMRAGDWIPADAQVIPLGRVTSQQLEQVVQLHLEYLGGTVERLRRQIGAGERGFDRDLSLVLLRGGRAVGFTLGGMLDVDVCGIDANVLERAHQLGWANLLLKLTATRLLRQRGVNTVRFQSCDHHTDTRKTTRMLGGTLRRESWLMYRTFTPRPPSSRSG